MRFLYSFAGIPSDAYETIETRKTYIVREDGEFFGAPFRDASLEYSISYLNKFASEFARRISSDKENRLIETGFALIYVVHKAKQVAEIDEAFFPSTLTVPVYWQQTGITPTEKRQRVNELVDLLRGATKRAKSALDALRNEATKRASKSPLLLPVKNFKSDHLSVALRALNMEIREANNVEATIAKFVSTMTSNHRQKDVPQEGRHKVKLTAFVDDKRVMFAPPGRDKHALARVVAGHPTSCLLNGRRRLGAPFQPAFHFDCTHGGERLEGDFHGCHEPPARYRGDPHINISPNDHVRA